jgi:type II secretion system protein G
VSTYDKLKRTSGFTLIELLVVIAIIGILSSVVLASLNGARESSRDARRGTDLNQIRTSLALYRDACGTYPSSTSDTAVNGSLGDSCGGGLSDYMSQVPTDPSSGNYQYVRPEMRSVLLLNLKVIMHRTTLPVPAQLHVATSASPVVTCLAVVRALSTTCPASNQYSLNSQHLASGGVLFLCGMLNDEITKRWFENKCGMLITVFTFIFGTIIGSGLNALDYRTGQDKSWLTDRSECPDCGHELAWWELIPIVSFLYLGGVCSQCKSSISWRYPLVEVAVGLLFMLIVQPFGISLAGLFAAVVWTLLVFIYIHDGRTMLVPNWAVWSFNALAFVGLFLSFPTDGLIVSDIAFTVPSWLAVASGPILAAPFALIWFFSGGRAMGFADAKIALGIGWLLGLSNGLSAIIYAFWIGAAFSLILLSFQRLWKSFSHDSEKQLTMKSAVPFGPFLVLGCAFVYFVGITLL